MVRAYVGMVAVFILLEIADLAVTLCGASAGAREGNPLMSPLFHMPLALAGVKLAATAIAAAVLLVFRHGSRRVQLAGMAIAGYGCILCAAVVIHNVVIIAR